MQGRSFDLVYQQYFNEKYSRLRTVLSAAEAVGATDVAINYGVWLRNEGAACGADAAAQTPCPPTAWVCSFLTDPHPFRVWWLATTPYARSARIVDEVPRTHPMNMQFVCNVSAAHVVDRVGALAALEPDEGRRVLLWWNADGPHFHADANHAFNQVLLHRLARPGRPASASLWRRWMPIP